MTHSLRLAVACLTLAACRPAVTRYPVAHTFAPAQLAADMRQLRAAIEEGAAALYRYRSKAAVARTFDSVQTMLDRPMTALEFMRIVAPAVASFEDAHLSVLPSQSITDATYTSPGHLLPLAVRVVGGALRVWRNPAGQEPPLGSEIMEINGVPAASLTQSCGSLVATDGRNTTRRWRKISLEFNFLCSPLLGFATEYRLTYRVNDTTVRTTSLAALNAGAWSRLQTGPASSPPPLQLEFLPQRGVAMLTLSSFSRSKAFHPERDFARAFADVRAAGVTDLIIDIRSNGGGRDSFGALLYSHIAADTFTYAVSRTLNKKRFTFIKRTDDWFLNWVSIFFPKRRTADGRWALARGLDRVQRAQADAFRGRVYLLVDSGTFSTASEFASVVKYYRRATMILGEETGTAYGGGSGAVVSFPLQHTGLFVNVPIVEYRLPSAADSLAARGVLPDSVITPTLEEMLHGHDAVRAAVLGMLERQR
jgi:hypothetical protein